MLGKLILENDILSPASHLTPYFVSFILLYFSECTF